MRPALVSLPKTRDTHSPERYPPTLAEIIFYRATKAVAVMVITDNVMVQPLRHPTTLLAGELPYRLAMLGGRFRYSPSRLQSLVFV